MIGQVIGQVIVRHRQRASVFFDFFSWESYFVAFLHIVARCWRLGLCLYFSQIWVHGVVIICEEIQ